MSRLQIVSASHGMRLQLNLLQLFRSYEEFHQVCWCMKSGCERGQLYGPGAMG